MALTTLALTNADLLRRFAPGAPPIDSVAALARELSRDKGNLSKTIGLLIEGGLLQRDGEGAVPTLAPGGVAALAAIARAEGPDVGPGQDATAPHALIVPDPDQPRKHFDPADLDELAESIAASQWISPLLVRPLRPMPGHEGGAYPLVAGERRWRAVSLLIERRDPRWDPATPIPVQIRDLTDQQVARLALVENMQRAGLRPLEEAEGFKLLIEKHGETTDTIAEAIGKTRRLVQQRLQLLDLSDEDKDRLNQGTLNVEQARKLVQDRPPPVQLTPAQLMQLAEIAAHIFPKAKPTAWKPADVNWTAVQDDLFAEVRDSGCVQFSCDFTTKVWFVSLSDTGVRALTEGAPDFLDDRDAALTRLRQAGGTVPADLGDRFVTPWLNAPFTASPEDLQRIEARRTEERQALEAREARELETATYVQTGAALLLKVRLFEREANDLASLEPGALNQPFRDRYAALWAEIGATPPFTIRRTGDLMQGDTVLEDAAGKPNAGYAGELEARRRLMAMGLNFSAGLPPFSGSPAHADEVAWLETYIDGMTPGGADAAADEPDQVAALVEESGLPEHVVRKVIGDTGDDDEAGPVLTGDDFSRQMKAVREEAEGQ